MHVVVTCEAEYLPKAGMLVLSGANQFLDSNVLHPAHDAPVHLQSTQHNWVFSEWVPIMCIDQHRQDGAVLSLGAVQCGNSTWLKGLPVTSGPNPLAQAARPGQPQLAIVPRACCAARRAAAPAQSAPPTWPDLVERL